jgi:hypothetical protein
MRTIWSIFSACLPLFDLKEQILDQWRHAGNAAGDVEYALDRLLGFVKQQRAALAHGDDVAFGLVAVEPLLFWLLIRAVHAVNRKTNGTLIELAAEPLIGAKDDRAQPAVELFVLGHFPFVLRVSTMCRPNSTVRLYSASDSTACS